MRDERRPRVRRRGGRNLRRFEKLRRASYPGTRRRVCSLCHRFDIEASFSGRLDVAKDAGFIRDETTHEIIAQDGFGHPEPFTRYRFVMTSVSDIRARRVPRPR